MRAQGLTPYTHVVVMVIIAVRLVVNSGDWGTRWGGVRRPGGNRQGGDQCSVLRENKQTRHARGHTGRSTYAHSTSYFPAGQSLQSPSLVPFPASTYLPAAHALHAVPLTAKYPAMQSSQSSACFPLPASTDFPAAHWLHLGAAAPAYCPAAHAVQLTAPAMEYRPAEHS